MSDPVYVKLTFGLKQNTPTKLKKLILYECTNYFRDFYPEKYEDARKTWDECWNNENYEFVFNFFRNDAYYTSDFQSCSLSNYDLYDIDTGEVRDINFKKYYELGRMEIGISVTTLPRSFRRVIEFLQNMKPYINVQHGILGYAQYYDEYLALIKFSEENDNIEIYNITDPLNGKLEYVITDEKVEEIK